MKTISSSKPRIAVRPGHKVLAETRAPSPGTLSRIADIFEFEFFGVCSTHQNGEGIVEAEWFGPIQFKTTRIFRLDALVNFLWIRDRLLLENRQETRTRILD